MEHDKKHSAEYADDSGSTDLNAVALAAQYVPGTDAEKALVWKIDKRIIVSNLGPSIREVSVTDL